MPSSRDDDTEQAVDSRVIRTRNDILRTALDVLISDGSEAVTHSRLARVAGYSRATVYKHWPTRTDLLRGAFSRLGPMPHHEPAGDLRTDLICELMSFRSALAEHRLDRALAVLVDLTTSTPELLEVRDQLVSDGEHVVRDLLAPQLAGIELETATVMLCGAILHAALLHDEPPADDVIAASVDLMLRGVPTPAQPTLIPAIPPSTASMVPVVDAASGLAK